MVKEPLLYYIEGLGESIIKLNDYVFDSGFEFVRYTLEEFENQFRDLFPIEKEYYDNEELTILRLTSELPNLRYFNHWEILENNCVIFLHDRFVNNSLNGETTTDKKASLEDVGKKISERESIKRVQVLIKNLKLFKSGPIKLLAAFVFAEDVGLFSRGFSLPSQKINYKKYSLTDTDFSESKVKIFEEQLLIPPYLELPFDSFLEYYNIEDEKIKFIILMIALESIFNKSSQEPIQHIISRHVAILLTIGKAER